MSREIMIIAKDKNGVISNNIVKIGENGEHIVIKGTKDTFYEIKDMATNRAPDQIYTKRFKNDLKLKINPKGGALDGVGEADVTIENYCANGNCEIVGVHESGEYYQYVPQSGDAGLETTKMADGEFAYQSLGTVEAGGFSPLAALPLAGLAGLGGGGGSKGDTTAPTATAIIKDIDDNVAPITGSVAKGGHTNDTTPTLSGTLSEALGSGEVVAVYRDGVKVGTAAVDSTGTGWSFTDTGVTDGSHTYTVRAEDTAGNKGTESTPYDIIVDTVAPDAANLTTVKDDIDSAPSATGSWGADTDTGSWNIDSTTGSISISGNVNVTSDGKIITNDNTPTLSGTGEAGTTVKIYDGDPDNPNNLVGQTTVASDGTWSITTEELQDAPLFLTNGDVISPLQNSEHTLNITLTDAAGNVSDPTPVEMIVDTINGYNMTHLTFNKGQADERSDIGGEVTGTDSHYYTGSITISDKSISEYGPGEKEIVSYHVGDEIYVTLINQETGDKYLIAERNSTGVDDAPTGHSTIVTDSSAGWSITVDFTQEYYNATTGNWETLPDGNYEDNVLVHEISGDIYIHNSSNQINNNGTTNPSDDVSFGIFGIDTAAPDASQVVGQTLIDDHTFTINVVDSAPMFFAAGDKTDGFQRESDYLVGTGVNELIIYRDGTYVGEKYISGEQTTTNWTDDASLNGVYVYQVDSIDVAGNHSGLGEKSWVLFDNDTNHNLTTADNDVSKDFSNMVLVGNNIGETFTLDSVGFKSIDGGAGIDTFVLEGSGQILDITKTTNFEVYNINGNTLNIGSNVVDGITDHVVINGTSSAHVDLGTDWVVSSSQTQSGYTIYTNTSSIDALWIQTGVIV
jgi:hypothetical protein